MNVDITNVLAAGVTLSARARSRLRSVIRNHPDLKEHMDDAKRIRSMTKSDLLKLAHKLGIDVYGVLNELDVSFIRNPNDREELHRYSIQFPAFKG